MVTKTAVIKEVKSFAKELRSSGITLRKVILFGSYAKNTQHEFSDIDLALAADEFTGVGFIDIKLFVKILKNFINIQPRTYSTEDFYTGDPFIEEIKKTGIEIEIEI
ncbi:MAG: hypothetical protein DRI94_06660 [Bacteroidetes bacterium]|nr:MAG: hypothetical protein DRI94_06660 [Bacteroidota bacterium]